MEKQAFKRIPVESSNIASIGHSFPRRILEVEFKNGSIYRYKGVNNKTYKSLLLADSKGKAFHRTIKGKYPYKKLVTKDGESVNETYKEASTVNYDEMVKIAYDEIMGTEKTAYSVSGDRIYLDPSDYSLRDLTKKEKVLEGAKTVGRGISRGAKTAGGAFAQHIKNNPEPYARLAALGTVAGGLYAYNEIRDRIERNKRRKRREKQVQNI